MLKRFILICVSFILSLAFIPNAVAIHWSPFKEYDIPENPTEFGIVVQLNLDSHLPYSKERLQMLNDILKHISLEISGNHRTENLRILIDNNCVGTIISEKDNHISRTWYSSFPDYIFETEGESANLFDEKTSVFLSADDNPYLYGYEEIEKLRSFLINLLELPADYCKEEKNLLKFKDYGTAVKKITLQFSSDSIQALFSRVGFHDFFSLQDWLGKQTLVCYADENDQPLKITLNGKCRIKDSVRNYSLSWKMLYLPEENIKDELVIKTPAASGNHRDNLIFSQRITYEGSTGIWDCTWTYDSVDTSGKQTIQGSAFLESSADAENHQLKGHFDSHIRNSAQKSYISLSPRLSLGNKGLEGTLAYSYGEDENQISESGTIFFSGNEALSSLSLPESAAVIDLNNASGVEMEQVLDGFSRNFLKALLQLPAEDLEFIYKDLDPDQRFSIQNALSNID